MKKICVFCGKEFETTGNKGNVARKIYCSYECRYKGNNGRNKRHKYHNFICSICGRVYLSNRKDSITCSPECRYERNKQLARERNQRAKQVEEHFLKEYQESKPKKKEVPPGWEIEAEARKHGMNYGQYYALMLQKQEIEERERRKKGEQQ
jgi:DNA-directed RNA polymerase subunit RPC12/RpoP